MSEDGIQLRKAIEQAAQHQAYGVGSRLEAKAPGRTEQSFVTFVDALLTRQRNARMQIDRHVRALLLAPRTPIQELRQGTVPCSHSGCLCNR